MQLYNLLCEEFSVSRQELSQFAFSAPKKYKLYRIPKRTSGTRLIAHPSRKLKKYQRFLASHLATLLPVHRVALAYKKGVGIKDNANKHRYGRYLLKMDFYNFFPSITPEIFFRFLESQLIEFSKEDKYLLTNLLFCNLSKKAGGTLRLSIGAPSSPLISNAIMYEFDDVVSSWCSELNVTYSRYADDLTFSTKEKNILFQVPGGIEKYLSSFLGGCISINGSKTVFSSKAHNRHVTGITITNEGKLSVGRDRKRQISSMIHKYSVGKLDAEDHGYLKGLLSFVLDIEPDFKFKMARKYSKGIVESLIKGSSGDE